MGLSMGLRLPSGLKTAQLNVFGQEGCVWEDRMFGKER